MRGCLQRGVVALVFLMVCTLTMVGCVPSDDAVTTSGSTEGLGMNKEATDKMGSSDGMGDSEQEVLEPVLPDEAIMEEMTCQPVDGELLERVKLQLGTPSRTVQVEVGEGLNPDELWWLIVLDSPADDSYEWGLRAFLTNAPGLSEGVGTWIPIDYESTDPWVNVRWDTERLIRAQSALTKALDYLNGQS